ncbi:Proteasome subunit beta type-1 [Binucleata daphniae]
MYNFDLEKQLQNNFELILPKLNKHDNCDIIETITNINLENNTKKHGNNEFNPYEFNAGTSLAISHKNTIIIASDTRHSSEMGINSRDTSKIHRFNDMYLITTGFYADGYQVAQRMKYNILDYETRNNKKISVSSAAHLLHNILYSKRFFPYYSYCLLCGFENGKAMLFSYDPVGSYANTDCRVDGSGACMLQPLLDSKISNKNRADGGEELSVEDVEKLVTIGFVSVAERDVKTGDFLEMLVIDQNSVREKKMPLRFD